MLYNHKEQRANLYNDIEYFPKRQNTGKVYMYVYMYVCIHTQPFWGEGSIKYLHMDEQSSVQT